MVRKTVTVREDQAKYLNDNHLDLTSWAQSKLEEWHEDDKEYPTGRSKRQSSMVRVKFSITDEMQDLLWEERVNLSHFIQDRLDERMEDEQRISGVDE